MEQRFQHNLTDKLPGFIEAQGQLRVRVGVHAIRAKKANCQPKVYLWAQTWTPWAQHRAFHSRPLENLLPYSQTNTKTVKLLVLWPNNTAAHNQPGGANVGLRQVFLTLPISIRSQSNHHTDTAYSQTSGAARECCDGGTVLECRPGFNKRKLAIGKRAPASLHLVALEVALEPCFEVGHATPEVRKQRLTVSLAG